VEAMRKLFFLVLLAPVIAFGDNAAAIQSLQNEPASLFDISLLRLQDYIVWTRRYMVGEYNHSAQADIGHMDINAYYVPDEARIVMSYSVRDTTSTPEQMQEGCERVLDISQINLLKNVPGVFIHEDGSWPPGLKESGFNLANLVRLQCYVWGDRADVWYFRTERPLAPHKALAESSGE
jgi:hypothetical protein